MDLGLPVLRSSTAEGGWTLDYGLRVARVRPQRQEKERCAEQVLAFGDPGDGIDLEGVEGEGSGEEGAFPKGAGEPAEREEYQAAIQGVDEQVDEVMAGGAESEQLAINHVGHPGQRMPVGVVAVQTAEGPRDAVPGEAGLDVRVGDNVTVVVVVDEVVPDDGPEREQGRRDQARTDEQGAAHAS